MICHSKKAIGPHLKLSQRCHDSEVEQNIVICHSKGARGCTLKIRGGTLYRMSSACIIGNECLNSKHNTLAAMPPNCQEGSKNLHLSPHAFSSNYFLKISVLSLSCDVRYLYPKILVTYDVLPRPDARCHTLACWLVGPGNATIEQRLLNLHTQITPAPHHSTFRSHFAVSVELEV